MTQQSTPVRISGMENGSRIESRILEERIQQAVQGGARNLEIEAHGQHGLGGRLWISKEEPLTIKIIGSAGQRCGSMGFPQTRIDVLGPASDDTGWLNAGATIVVHGNAANGTGNAMAQGKIYVGGQHRRPRHDHDQDQPALPGPGTLGAGFHRRLLRRVHGWRHRRGLRLRGAGPGERPRLPPLRGHGRGRIFVRGPHKGFSQNDARLEPMDDATWQWLSDGLLEYLEAIGKSDLSAPWPCATTGSRSSPAPPMKRQDASAAPWRSSIRTSGMLSLAVAA